jgi:hypothetical protein
MLIVSQIQPVLAVFVAFMNAIGSVGGDNM